MKIKLNNKISHKILQYFINKGIKESQNQSMTNFFIDKQSVNISVASGDDQNYIIIKDNPVPSLDRIQLGNERPTDSTMKLDDKEYLIESDAWNIITLLKENRLNLLLDYIYENFDKDLVQNGVETNKEQPKCKNCNFNLKQINSICDECGYDQGY